MDRFFISYLEFLLFLHSLIFINYIPVTVWERPKNYYTAEQYAVKLAMMENKSDAVEKNQVTEPDKLKSGILSLHFILSNKQEMFTKWTERVSAEFSSLTSSKCCGPVYL